MRRVVGVVVRRVAVVVLDTFVDVVELAGMEGQQPIF